MARSNRSPICTVKTIASSPGIALRNDVHSEAEVRYDENLPTNSWAFRQPDAKGKPLRRPPCDDSCKP
jgi:hypothetical protein